MNWQVNTYCWGRSVATQENLDPGEKRINRIYYIHSGEAYLELDSGRQRLLPGWLYVLPESMRIYISMAETDPLDHTFFDFDALPCFSFRHVIGIETAQYPLIQKMLETLQQLYLQYQRQSRSPEILSAVNSILPNLLWMISKVEDLAVTNDSRILDTLFYIQKHLDQDLSVQTLAARIFLDESYFIRLFNENTGQTPFSYIRSRRMHRAKTLMQQGFTAKNAAEQCGYDSYSAFSRAFKQYYGVSPIQISAKEF